MRRWSWKRSAPEDKTRNEVLGARVNLYMAAKKWDMAATAASYVVKVDPDTAGWWISPPMRSTESKECDAISLAVLSRLAEPTGSSLSIAIARTVKILACSTC
jgi:hypothetical protein